MARSTLGSSANATAGGKSLLRPTVLFFVGPNEIARGATDGASKDPSLNAELADSDVSSCETIRVAFGLTVLLSLSPSGLEMVDGFEA
jgi:hypothetical protein